MSVPTEELGGLSLNAGQVAISITAVTSLTVPTTAQRVKKGGQLQCELSIEGQNGRYRYTASPTAANGVLLTAPGFLIIRGEDKIKNFKIIGVAAGGLINYEFSVGAIA